MAQSPKPSSETCCQIYCLGITVFFWLFRIADVNECAESTHNCNANAMCTDMPGSFLCVCNGGYTGDGVDCQGNAIMLNVRLMTNIV